MPHQLFQQNELVCSQQPQPTIVVKLPRPLSRISWSAGNYLGFRLLGIPSLRNDKTADMFFLISIYDYKMSIVSIYHRVKTRVSLISLYNVKVRFKSDHLLPR